jgi:hypothetical protein
MSTNPSTSKVGRNRMIAIVVGAVTVVAVVLGFAGDYLGLPSKGLRPAAELLLLAELVVLVVLERHQLFEPVHETVGSIHQDIGQVLQSLGSLNDKLDSSGQVTTFIGAPQLVAARAKLLREALGRLIALDRLSVAVKH